MDGWKLINGWNLLDGRRLTKPPRPLAPRFLRSEAANSLIEMACVLPVFFLMTFTFINFAMVIYGMGNANFASRQALRFATLHSNTSYAPASNTDLKNLVAAYIPAFPANTYTVSSTYNGGNQIGSQCFVTVTVTYNIAVLGYTFRNIAYTSTGSGIVLQ